MTTDEERAFDAAHPAWAVPEPIRTPDEIARGHLLTAEAGMRSGAADQPQILQALLGIGWALVNLGDHTERLANVTEGT